MTCSVIIDDVFANFDFYNENFSKKREEQEQKEF